MNRSLTSLFMLLMFFGASFVIGEENQIPAGNSMLQPSLETLLEKIEKKYASTGFTVNFDQESTLKAMEITDTATGKAIFNYPDKMRWEYEEPYKQLIVSNGSSLWIYKPEDNQVMLGKSPEFFGDGKGASFLTDISSIREKFNLAIVSYGEDNNNTVVIKLIPYKKDLDLEYILLTVSTKTYEIVQISTFNAYEDETKIRFRDLQFVKSPDSNLFTFKVPKGADVLYYDE